MLLHLALFRPRSDLNASARTSLFDALDAALRDIPSIRHFQVGRRLRHGAGYEHLMPVDLPFAALIAFDDLDGLHAYLEHPSHQALGRLFMESLDASAIYDYEMVELEQLRKNQWPARLGRCCLSSFVLGLWSSRTNDGRRQTKDRREGVPSLPPVPGP